MYRTLSVGNSTVTVQFGYLGVFLNFLQGAALLQRPELMHMFNRGREAIDQYLKKERQTEIKQSFPCLFHI
jgi:hypothetical protein